MSDKRGRTTGNSSRGRDSVDPPTTKIVPCAEVSSDTRDLTSSTLKDAMQQASKREVKLVLGRIEEMDANVNRNIKSLTDTIRELTDKLMAAEQRYSTQNTKIVFLESRVKQLEIMKTTTLNRLDDIENLSRVNNLIIIGKPEVPNEDLREYITALAQSIGTTCEPEEIDAIYRLGRLSQSKNRIRPILIRFHSVQKRHDIYRRRFDLKGKTDWQQVWINDDVNESTRRKRNDMRSVSNLCREKQVDCKVHSDGLVIRGVKVHLNEMNKLPDDVSLVKAKTVARDGDIFFQSHHSFLSNMYPAPVHLDNMYFPTAEHAFQHAKAKALYDDKAMAQIMATDCSYEAKKNGDRVRSNQAWENARDQTMRKIVRAKFDQNDDLKIKLVATGNVHLHEATRDLYWGTGATLITRRPAEGKWLGRDKLGKLLDAIRDEYFLSQ